MRICCVLSEPYPTNVYALGLKQRVSWSVIGGKYPDAADRVDESAAVFTRSFDNVQVHGH